MGLFGGGDEDAESNEDDHQVADLVAGASHDSVTEKRLTQLKAGRMSRYLHDAPLVEYLEDGEQPHFVLAARNKAPSASGPNPPEMPTKQGTGMVMHLVTDERWLVVAANGDGDQALEVPLDAIRGVEYDLGGHGSHDVTLALDDSQITTPIANLYDDEDIEALARYLGDATDADVGDLPPETSGESDAGDGTDSGFANIDVDGIRNDDLPSDSMLANIDEDVQPGETVHYAYAINAAERGDDTMGGYTTGGVLLATDSRLTAYINETIGSSNLSIDYDRVETVEVERGAIATKLSVQSTSKTYSFPGFNSIDSREINEFAQFVRDQAKDASTTAQSGSGVDPTQQLKNVKELHDEGVLTDEEFEEKKQALLDKL